MRGNCPRPLLRTTSKSQLMPSYGNECPPAVVEAKPVLGAPHHVVIGFDLGTESKNVLGGVCESPRSVLEPSALCIPVHQQSRSPRSPRSALGSLLSSHPQPQQHHPCKEGVGLGFLATIKAEEDAEAAKFEACKASLRSEPIPVNGHTHVRRPQNQWQNPGAAGWASGGSWVANSYSNSSKVFVDNHYEGDDDEEMDIRESIFSTASPASGCCSFDFLAIDFLSVCFFCKHRLLQGKDIYMYRGDRAFCSSECRYQQIAIDERKERRATAASCYSAVPTHHNRVLAASPAALA